MAKEIHSTATATQSLSDGTVRINVQTDMNVVLTASDVAMWLSVAQSVHELDDLIRVAQRRKLYLEENANDGDDFRSRA